VGTLQAAWAALNRAATPGTLTAIAGAVAAWQLFLGARFALRLRAQALRPKTGFSPPVSLIVACKGQPRGFERNIRSLLDQDYPGVLEYLFVTPSAADPAHARLAELLSGRPRARLLVSGAVPVRCSEKILNMLHALRRASAGSEVLAFADCDIEVRPDWLSRLVAPLERPETVASSAPSLYAADTLNPLQSLRMAWMALVQCSLDYFGSVIGWSWAIRRADFEGLGLEKVWSRSLTDDFVLNPLLRGTGRRIEWALLAMPVCRENPSAAELLVPFIKGFQYFRVNDPALWLMGGLEALGKLYLVLWFLRMGLPWRAALVPAADAAAALAALRAAALYAREAARAVHPALRGPAGLLAAAASAAAMTLLRPVVFAVSLVSRTVRWGGYLYDFRASDDCRVIGRAAAG
jgi:hypothetical protein